MYTYTEGDSNMMNGQKTQPPQPAVTAAEEKNGVEAHLGVTGRSSRRVGGRNGDVAQVVLRVMCMAASVTAISFMVTARQASTASFYGFQLQLHSKWSFSCSFEYLLGISAAATGYSLLQLLISGSRLLNKSPVISSRNQAWFNFAADQIFAYVMMSAGSAASGVTNLNRTGIRHTALPNFCKALDSFCDHVAISIVFTFFSCILLATSAVQDVIWLSKY